MKSLNAEMIREEKRGQQMFKTYCTNTDSATLGLLKK